MAKGIARPIKRNTHSRANKMFGRVFVDICGKKKVSGKGGKKYMLLICDDYSRFTWVYFLRSKSEAVVYFKQFLSDVRATGTPSTVEIVRSDEGGEFSKGNFPKMCRDRNNRQEFTTADSPEFNGVAERRIAMVESAGLAAHLQAIAENPGAPKGASMWPERAFWACDALNRTATSANPENKSPFEMRYRKVPRSPFPFLRQG